MGIIINGIEIPSSSRVYLNGNPLEVGNKIYLNNQEVYRQGAKLNSHSSNQSGTVPIKPHQDSIEESL